MKKTFTINLGGIVFHIDEDAYELLDKYLSNLRIHFSKEEGAEEIVHDMELRISELFSERLHESKTLILRPGIGILVDGVVLRDGTALLHQKFRTPFRDVLHHLSVIILVANFRRADFQHQFALAFPRCLFLDVSRESPHKVASRNRAV